MGQEGLPCRPGPVLHHVLGVSRRSMGAAEMPWASGGHQGRCQPRCRTWQVDVGRRGWLAKAMVLRAAILQDVLNGWHSAPCDRQAARSGPSPSPKDPLN